MKNLMTDMLPAAGLAIGLPLCMEPQIGRWSRWGSHFTLKPKPSLMAQDWCWPLPKDPLSCFPSLLTLHSGIFFLALLIFFVVSNTVTFPAPFKIYFLGEIHIKYLTHLKCNLIVSNTATGLCNLSQVTFRTFSLPEKRNPGP